MAELGIAASIISVIQLTGTVTQYLLSVKGASKDRQRILNELSNVTSILFVLKVQADEAEHDDSWDKTLRKLNESKGPLDQFKAALETLAAKIAPVKGLKKLRESLKWPFQEKEIKDILITIERLKTLFILARQNDHLALTEALKNDVMSIQDGVDDIGRNIARIQISDYQNNVIRWLSAPDPSLNYNTALKARHVKTGTWLIESEVFHRWTLNAGSLLWLYGIPGCGKTILSSTIIQYLLDHSHQIPRSAVLYFYFNFNESEKQRHENMIRSLITQLIVCQKSTSNVLDSLHSRGRQPTGEELLATLHAMMTASNEVFIILDALDECTERPELLSNIEEIMSWKDIHLHILTTSRREADIEGSLEPLCDEGTNICIQSALVNADIRIYVHDRLSEDKKFKRWRNYAKVQLEIETTLMEKADGMFRWAVCQLDTLGSCVTLPQLRKALQSLPKDLDATYERILCRIDDPNHAYALKILQWLTFSARPLALEEIAEVIAIDVHDDPRFDPERRLPDPPDIMTICSSLITIDGEEIQDVPRTLYTPVRLAHFSVKEYLVSDRIRIGKASGYSIRESESITVVAQDCLVYLLCLEIADVCTPPEIDNPTSGSLTSVSSTPEHGKEFPLALYAARHWTLHAQMAERIGTMEASSLVLELLCSEGAAFENWIRLCHSNSFSVTNPSFNLGERQLVKIVHSPLHFVSLLGLVTSVRILLEWGYDADARVNTITGEISALCAACMKGHPLIVKILLDNGAVINSNNSNEVGAPLYEASYFDHEEVVRLLLDSGADVNAQGGYYGNALQAASYKGLIEIVQLLVKKGTDMNAQGGYYGNALQAASFEGSKETVRLLIEKGADVNAQGGLYGNALQAASERGKIEVVQLLIEKGADVNARGGSYLTALQAAIVWKRSDVVQLLIDNGALTQTEFNIREIKTLMRLNIRASRVWDGIEQQSESGSHGVEYQSESDSDGIENQSEEDPDALQQGCPV